MSHENYNYTLSERIELHHGAKELISQEVISNSALTQEGKKNKKLSYVVVAYNELLTDLERCLNSIYSQENFDAEIIFVDNGLPNETRTALTHEYEMSYIVSGSNLGCCGGRNLGSSFARGEFLAFIDADGYIDQNFQKEVETSFAKHSDVIAMRGRVIEIQETAISGYAPSHYDLGDIETYSMIDTEGISTFRREDFLKAGGFEESLVGGEGLVLCYRLCEYLDYDWTQFMYNPRLVLHHSFVQSKERLHKKINRGFLTSFHTNNAYPLLKHFSLLYANRSTTPLTEEQKSMNDMVSQRKKKFLEEQSMCFETNLRSISPNFSVIIPCYNLGSVIDTAIDSLKKQSLQNIELIIVDDCSTDQETIQKLKQLEKDYHVKYQENNEGVSVARNAGIQAAKSEYILCLDADDYIESAYLEKAKNIFDNMPDVGIVSCGVQTFGAQESRYIPKDKIDMRDALVNSPVHTASCFRKSDWKSGAIYDPRLRGYEDWDHWLRIMKLRRTVRVIPEYLFNYYVRPGSKVETSNKNSFKLVSAIIENHKELYQKYFAYVIAKKHEALALNINASRKKSVSSRENVGAVSLLKKVMRILTLLKKKIFPYKWI